LASYLTLNGNNTHAYFTNPGNVGIGVTGPVAPLDVFGAAVQNGSTPGIKLSSSNTQQTVFAIGNTGTRQYELAVGGTTSSVPGAFYIYDNNAEDFRITLATSGNVGIGTTNPGVKLEVEGSYGNVIKAVSGSQNITTNFVAPSTGGGLNNIISTGGDFNIGSSDAKSFDLTTNSVSRVAILSDGKVGIGTTSPSQKLEVAGSVAVTGTNVTVANASNPYIYINDTNAGAGIFQQEGNTTRIGSDSNTQVVLVQNNATAVTIDTSKNVGIGTTSPDSKLHVAGGTRLGGGGCYISTDASFSTNFSYTFRDAVGINNPNSVSAPSVAGYVMSVGRSISGGVGGGIYVEGESRFARGLAGAIKFNAYDGTNNTGSPTHILGTDASGNVVKSTAGSSIGPWLPLAGGTMTGVTQFNDHTNYGDQVYARFGASQDLQIFHNGTDSFIDNYTGSLTIRNRQDDGHIVFTCDDGSGGLASYLTLNGNNTHAYFTNPGNVGIGTTSPNVPLEVHGADITTRANTTAQSVLRLVRDVTDSNYTSTKDSAVDFMLSRQQTVNNNLPYTRLDIRLAGTTDSSTPSLDVMSLLHNGNVGIGTTSPSQKLTVVGNTYISSGLLLLDNNQDIRWGDAGERITGNNTNGLVFTTNNLEAMRINSAGNVGIGTNTFASTPNLQLKMGNMGSGIVGEIFDAADDADNSRIIVCGGGSGTPQFSMRLYSAGYGIDMRLNTNSPWDTYIDNRNAASGFIFRNNCNNDGGEDELMRITGSGNVGIGTTSPDSKLDVKGPSATPGS
jgi:hypothetical protein